MDETQQQPEQPPNPSSRFRLSKKQLAQVALLYLAAALFLSLTEDTLRFIGLTPKEFQNEKDLFGLALTVLIVTATEMFATALRYTFFAGALRPLDSALSRTRSIELQVIEGIRSLAAVIIRFPLLVLPALVEWLRLVPVPFVVLFDPAYRRGEIDALKASRHFFRDHPWFVQLVLLPPSVVWAVDFFLSTTPQDSLPLWEAPAQHVGSIAIIVALHLAQDAFVLSQYRKKMTPALSV